MTAPGGHATGGHNLSAAQSLRALVAMIGSTFIALIGQFMLTPWLVFQLEQRGTSSSLIGWFGAVSWLGLLVTTPFATRIVATLGQRRALLLSLAIPMFSAFAIAHTESVWLWGLLQFIGSSAMSVRWIVAEACIAELAPARRRGRIVSAYQTLLSVAFIIAPALLAWLRPANPDAPAIAAAFLALGLAMTLAVPGMRLEDHSRDHTGFKGLRRALLAYPAVVAAGFLGGLFELGITSLLPLYGLALGYTAASAAMLLAASGTGSMLVMVPLGEAADRLPAARIGLAGATLILLTAGLALTAPDAPLVLWVLALLWGAAGGGLYTLSMISLGRVLRGSALISATAMLVLSYTAGGLIGPIVAGYALETSLRWGLATAIVLIASAALVIMSRRPMR